MALLSKEGRYNPFVHYTFAYPANVDADREYHFKTQVPLKWEYTSAAADAADSTDKILVTVSYKGPSDSAYTVIASGTDVVTADTPTVITDHDSTAPVNNVIPAGSLIRVLVDESGTGTAVLGVAVDVAFSYAR